MGIRPIPISRADVICEYTSFRHFDEGSLFIPRINRNNKRDFYCFPQMRALSSCIFLDKIRRDGYTKRVKMAEMSRSKRSGFGIREDMAGENVSEEALKVGSEPPD